MSALLETYLCAYDKQDDKPYNSRAAVSGTTRATTFCLGSVEFLETPWTVSHADTTSCGYSTPFRVIPSLDLTGSCSSDHPGPEALLAD